MLPSALKVKRIQEETKGLKTKIIVGGAPFRLDPELWKEVGADGYCKDASEIFNMLEEVME
jgi:methanogenic corrinoid protein MtbC1